MCDNESPGSMTHTWTMYFIEKVVSRRVFIYHGSLKLSGRPQRGSTTKRRITHRVVITLEKFAQGDDGLRVGRESTEEIDEILIAHA